MLWDKINPSEICIPTIIVVVLLKMETRLDGTSITFQAGDEHYHDGKFIGRGIHPKLQAQLDQHIHNKMTAPKDLLHVLRNSNLINATNMVEPKTALSWRVTRLGWKISRW